MAREPSEGREWGLDFTLTHKNRKLGLALFYRRSKKKRILKEDPPLAPQRVRNGAAASLEWRPVGICLCDSGSVG